MFVVIIMSDIRRLLIPTHFFALSSWHNCRKSKLLSSKACLIFPKVAKCLEQILKIISKISRKIEFICQLKMALFPLCTTWRSFMTLGKIKQALPLKSLDFLRLCYEDDATKCVGIKSLRISDLIITIKLW